MSVITDFFTNVKTDIEEYTNDRKEEIEKVKMAVVNHEVTDSIFDEDYITSESEKRFSFAFSQLRIVERYEIFNKEVLLKKLDKKGFEDVTDMVLLHIAYIKACEEILTDNADISDDYLICMYLENGRHKVFKDELGKRKLFDNGKQQFPDDYIELRKSKKEFLEILSRSEMAKKIIDRLVSFGTDVYIVIFDENKIQIIGEENTKLEEIVYRKEGYPNLSEFQNSILVEYIKEHMSLKYDKIEKNILKLNDSEKGIRLSW